MNTAAERSESPEPQLPALNLEAAAKDIGEEDWRQFNRLTSVELSPEERDLAARPDRVAPKAREYLAVHWHPEWAPLEFIRRRLDLAFPLAENSLAIPTQHNKVLAFGPWAGVEADVYDRKYGQKVQLLIHFSSDRLPRASAFLSMMNHTYNYRAHQLLDILGRLAKPDKVSAAIESGLQYSISLEGIMMARFYAIRLKALIEESGIIGGDRDEMLKNRLLPDFIAARTGPEQRLLAEQAFIYIKAVKKSVKSNLNPAEFFSPEEVIEEARSLNGGVVIPHPPQFWPILLADLDVDGWEVWNSSTPHHTLFLLEALNRANAARGHRRELLAFMGDDTHMSAKFRLNNTDEKDSVNREIGFQPPWDEPAIRSLLHRSGQSRSRTINEYRIRLL